MEGSAVETVEEKISITNKSVDNAKKPYNIDMLLCRIYIIYMF